MAIQVTPEAEILHEATQILLQHMAPSKVVRFWASWHRGGDSYLAWRDDMFAHESVDSLYAKIVAFQENSFPEKQT